MIKYYDSKFYNSPIQVIYDNGEIIILIKDSLNRDSIYTWYNTKNKNSNSPYINKCLLGGFLQNSIKNVLVIGVGGGAFIKYLEDNVSDIKITGIEIDEAMIKIAKNELFIKTDDIIIGDLRDGIDVLLDRESKYDLILFDIYGGAGEIPEGTLNLGILKKMKKLLNDTGIFSINYSNFAIYSKNKNDIKRVKYYKNIHIDIKNVFNKEFILFLSGKNDYGNVSGIYNLEKKYNLNEIKKIYFNKVDNGEITYDSKIIEGIYLDNDNKVLN